MIYQKFKKFVEVNRLFGPQSHLLVAVSGGQDSVALVHLLLELKKEWPELEIALAHYNHHLRASAGADEKFVRQLARKVGLKIFVGQGKVREFARKYGLNLEEAARRRRYEFLEKTAEKWGADFILTAHTMTDQAETVLMKIFRGTGMEGLQGIRVKKGNVVRPLLCLRRGEIEQYLKEKNLNFRVDETNLDVSLLRNKIRIELIPQLEREYDPEVVSHLAQLALIAQAENEALSELVEGLWPLVVKNGGHNTQTPIFARGKKGLIEKSGREEGKKWCGDNVLIWEDEEETERKDEVEALAPEIELNLAALKEIPLAIARRLVRKFLHLVLGLKSPSFEQTEAVLALEEGQKFSWGKDNVLVREQGWLRRAKSAWAKPQFSIVWNGKENLRVPGGWEFQGKLVQAKKLGQLVPNDAQRCYLDAGRLKFPLEVRNRRPGDKYRPLGLRGEKKLKELLRERKIPREERDWLPVFVSGGQIVWVPGLPVAENFKVTPGTKKIFVIEILRETKDSETDDR
ncbi:MAG: tRNA lysidine(34) synthetase TilS [Candidatus Aminicenantes bacterium]|nr:tRNA lysidine(34) synthetase TilS [Candidatus Aminicenantes bacterium]